MKKINTSDSIIYYHVSDYINNLEFYVAIDKKNKLLKYFLSNDFSIQPLGIIDFSDPSKKIGDIPGLDSYTIIRTSFLAYKAVLKNEFPNMISYISS